MIKKLRGAMPVCRCLVPGAHKVMDFSYELQTTGIRRWLAVLAAATQSVSKLILVSV